MSSIKPTAPTSLKPDIPRRVVDSAAPGHSGTGSLVLGRRPDGAAPAAPAAVASSSAVETRRLTVGREISLSGEITACDVLVVEGTVEAKLRDGRNIEIAESGLFRGSVEIDAADIAGRFEGDLTVRGRLRVRASGRITGTVRYGELEVEAGGQLSGQIHTLTEPAAPVAAPVVAEAVQPSQYAPAIDQGLTPVRTGGF